MSAGKYVLEVYVGGGAWSEVDRFSRRSDAFSKLAEIRGTAPRSAHRVVRSPEWAVLQTISAAAEPGEKVVGI